MKQENYFDQAKEKTTAEVRSTETITGDDFLMHDVDSDDYSIHISDCKYCEARKKDDEKR